MLYPKMISKISEGIFKKKKQIFGYSFFVIGDKMMVGIAGEAGSHCVHTNLIFTNIWVLKLLIRIFHFFATMVKHY